MTRHFLHSNFCGIHTLVLEGATLIYIFTGEVARLHSLKALKLFGLIRLGIMRV